MGYFIEIAHDLGHIANPPCNENKVPHSIRSIFRVLGIYNLRKKKNYDMFYLEESKVASLMTTHH